MAERQVELQPFLGVVSLVDDTLIPDTAASDMLNVKTEDGKITPRNGWQHLSGVPTGFTYCACLQPLRGFDSSTGSEKYTLLSVETRSGTMKPYETDGVTGVRSTITDNGTPLSLTVAEWGATAYDGVAFCHSIGGSVYKHTINDLNSWTAADAAQPPVPTTAPTVEFEVTEETDTGATVFPWTGLAGLTNNGGGATNVSFVSVTSGSVNIDFPTVSGVDQTIYDFTLDFSGTAAGIQDWSGVKFITFTFTHSLSGNNGRWALQYPYDANFIVKLINNDGSPITITMDTEVDRKIGTSTVEYKVKATFPSSATMTDWDNTRKLRLFIEDNYPNHATQNVRFALSSITPNTAVDVDPALPTTKRLRFGYVFNDSERDVQSGTVKESRWYRMQTDAEQRFFQDTGGKFLGNVVNITVDDIPSQANVDQYILFVWWEDLRVWQTIGTYDISDLTQEVDLSFTNLRALPSRTYRAYTPIGSQTLFIGSYGGSLVFLKAGTQSNVKVSAVGKPTTFYDPDYDDTASTSRGNTLNMSPSFDDQPVCCQEAANSLIVLGQRGAYASVGQGYAASLLPFHRLPNSKGVLAMRCSCRYRDDEGVNGVAYIGSDYELYFVAAYPGFDGTDNFKLTELSKEVRGLIRSFLTSNSVSPNVLRMHVGYDDRSDSLWLFYAKRAMRLSRPGADGQRHWSLYEYSNTTGWYRFAIDQYYGIRAVRDTGVMDELEYDSTNNWLPITGALRDDGAAISNGVYWTSKTYHDVNRRMYTVLVERETMSDTVTVTVYSDRATTSKTIAAGDRHAKFPVTQQGWNHRIKVELGTNSSPVTKVVFTERYPSSRKLNA